MGGFLLLRLAVPILPTLDIIFIARMFIVMTIQAKQFPVTAVAGVVIVVMVAMMHGQFAQVFARKFACAAAAYPRVKLERLFAIALATFVAIGVSVGYDFVEFCVVEFFVHGVGW